MKKLFTAIIFAAGAVFGLFFSNKKGEDIRNEINTKDNPDKKAELIGEEIKAMLNNFWKTIKNPLRKGIEQVKQEIKEHGQEYRKEAKKIIGQFKEKTENEIRKDLTKVRKDLSKKMNKAKKTIQKRIK